ncbi:MAG: enoyl-CoA hydratase-related protein, partial [Vicinamibacterales bacterium]
MTRFVRTDIDPPVALLTIDNPPVNALTAGVWADIDAAVSAAAADPAVGAIVLIGGGTRFVAGADIRLFDQIQTSDDAMSRSAAIHAILRRIEDTPKPVIAAIHGQALGGGLELAMACHFRLAAADAELGLPEVRLGLIPGAGGTQRLPRLCGPELALRLCTGGTPMRAAEAHSVGLVDRLVGVETGKNGRDLRQYARQFAREVATRAEVRRTRDIAIDRAAVETGRRACEATRAALTTSARGTQAPLAVVDAIEAALAMGFDEGSVREREIFATRVLSLESRALRHLFFAERAAARLPVSVTSVPPVEIRSAAVVGAGTMGAGIAMTYANAGIPVLVKEVDEAALVRGMETIRRTYDSAVTRKRIDAAERDRRLALITPTTVFDEFAATDIVVEAVFEDLALKRQVFAELGRVTRPTCILATNTSTLDVDAIAAACGRPSRVVGH